MSDTPNYGFYKHPRFSANHLADYLCTNDATQRERVIRDAKFPKKAKVIPYQRVTPIFRDFLRNGNSDLSYFDRPRERLAAQAKKEDGPLKSELLRCIKAIDAFMDTYVKGRLDSFQFGTAHTDIIFKLCGVSINCRLTPPISHTSKNGSLNSGGCVFFLAGSAPARKNIEDRTKFVAATVHWALESVSTNIEPLPKLCLSFDVFGKNVVSAPAAYSRLRNKMEASCREVANGWDQIEPPSGYDGVPWR
jgi:hypothetical protein